MLDIQPIKIFIAYSHSDEAYLKSLRRHLSVIEDDDLSIWYDGEILPGDVWDTSIKSRLREADIILLLVSVDFLTSDYVKNIELPTALERHEAGECKVVPVILRSCMWERKLGTLQALPVNASAIENWPSRDNACHNVVEGLEKLIKDIRIRKPNRQVEGNKMNVKTIEYNSFEDPFLNQMVIVKGGKFDMGGSFYREGKPVHQVKISSFNISKYVVTKMQWAGIMGENASRIYNPNNPVGKVSWFEVEEFIKKLNQHTGKQYRLPTEAEWEYAARGGIKSKNYEYAGSNDLNEVGWFEKNTDKIQPVGQKKPNEIGLYDMSGNVWEWCEDLWHDNYKGAPINGKAWLEGGEKDIRVIRGGSIEHTAAICRIGIRIGEKVKKETTDLSFRLVHD